MRPPEVVKPAQLEEIPDTPAVFLLWASSGAPYLARTALLRRRLKRLLGDHAKLSRITNFAGLVERIEYWATGSQLESALIHLELAKLHFPADWQKITRIKPPVFLRLTLENPFPRTMTTTRFGKGLHYGPFPSRAAAERFDAEMLDLFQLRRCEDNLVPSPDHPGCMYGEMNKCQRPCQQVVSIHEYAHEAHRVEQFLRTNGASLANAADTARDRASADMDFEQAERWHETAMRIAHVRATAGDLARELSQLNGVAVEPSAKMETVELWFLIGGRWQERRRVDLSEMAGAGQSLDQRIREIVATLEPASMPDPEHLALLLRWHSSTWRDGEWISIEALEKAPYRKIVNAIGRVAKGYSGAGAIGAPQ